MASSLVQPGVSRMHLFGQIWTKPLLYMHQLFEKLAQLKAILHLQTLEIRQFIRPRSVTGMAVLVI